MGKIEDIAKKYNGRSTCKGCPFGILKCTKETMELCNLMYIKGFMAGVKYYKKESSRVQRTKAKDSK